ncbi:unnamed protein product [Amaranthus hypochondriacus]
MLNLHTTTPMFLIIILTLSTNVVASFHRPSSPVFPGRKMAKMDELSDWKVAKISDFIKVYKQTLDHFNYRPASYKKFAQRYFIYDKVWGGAKTNSPIFVNMGSEMDLETEIQATGLLLENAPHFNALLLFIEHRYYGLSNPMGTLKETLKKKNTEMRGYFNSAQALADYAEIILHIKAQYSAHHCPVIVFGASYGGLLAAWMRLKYPHVAAGALASSAPILYHIKPRDTYVRIVTKDFRDTSENCYKIIKQSWGVMDRIASRPGGYSVLAKKLKTCSVAKSIKDLKQEIEGMISSAAQYDSPPYYPVNQICKAIDNSPKTSHVLEKLAAGLLAIANSPCVDITTISDPQSDAFSEWQSCSELTSSGIASIRNDSIFDYEGFNVKKYSHECTAKFGVPTRPDWIIQYYGEHDYEFVLRRFGSNIIFSNGLRDPLSYTGILKNISDTIVAVYASKGGHAVDVGASDKSDPAWLTAMRNKEMSIIKGWLITYNADLKAYLKGR